MWLATPAYTSHLPELHTKRVREPETNYLEKHAPTHPHPTRKFSRERLNNKKETQLVDDQVKRINANENKKWLNWGLNPATMNRSTIERECCQNKDWNKYVNKNPKGYSTGYSRVVPHHSTNPAHSSLTSQIRRDGVHSARYGRNHQTPSWNVYLILIDGHAELMLLAWIRPLFAHLRSNKHPARVHLPLFNSSLHILNEKNIPPACILKNIHPLGPLTSAFPPPQIFLSTSPVMYLTTRPIQWPHISPSPLNSTDLDYRT